MRRPSVAGALSASAMTADGGAVDASPFLEFTAGAQAVAVHLVPDRTYSATSVNFSVSERLMHATGLSFAIAP